MKRKRKNEIYLKRAGFTIETALLMPLILIVVLSLFFLLLYLYNLGIMQEAACRGAKQFFYYNGETNKNIEKECAKVTLNDLQENLVGVKNADVKVIISAGNIEIEITGELYVPNLILPSWQDLQDFWKYDVSWNEIRIHPAENIRTQQQLQKIYDEVIAGKDKSDEENEDE